MAHSQPPVRSPILLTSVLLAIACHSSAKQPPPDTPPDATAVPDEPQPAEPIAAVEPGRSYDLVVSFFSPGDGTDAAASQRLDEAVVGVAGVVRATGHWGREGEHDECFILTGLSEADRAAFIAKAKAAVADSKKVNVSEQAVCQDRGL